MTSGEMASLPGALPLGRACRAPVAFSSSVIVGSMFSVSSSDRMGIWLMASSETVP